MTETFKKQNTPLFTRDYLHYNNKNDQNSDYSTNMNILNNLNMNTNNISNNYNYINSNPNKNFRNAIDYILDVNNNDSSNYNSNNNIIKNGINSNDASQIKINNKNMQRKSTKDSNHLLKSNKKTQIYLNDKEGNNNFLNLDDNKRLLSGMNTVNNTNYKNNSGNTYYKIHKNNINENKDKKIFEPKSFLNKNPLMNTKLNKNAAASIF